MNNEELLYENAMLREIIREQSEELERLEQKLYDIELCIKKYEGNRSYNSRS